MHRELSDTQTSVLPLSLLCLCGEMQLSSHTTFIYTATFTLPYFIL
jgi:hypothetical protein